MPAATRDEAVELLTREVETNLAGLDLCEVYNEYFDDARRTTEAEARDDRGRLIREIVTDLRRASAGELAERWGLILPDYRRVEYDVDDDLIYYRLPKRLRTG